MLQPSQVSDVAIRYTEEIAELRDFLIKAGCTVRTGQSLGQIAARLLRDRAFHRDLTSTVWVVIDRYGRISYSDLLGVLAIAAAGPSLASTADENDAHCLLRFLMEARHSLDTLSDTKDGDRARETTDATDNSSIGRLQPARGNQQEVYVEPLRPVETDVLSLEGWQDSGSGRRGFRWAVAGGCVLAAVFIGLWLKHWSSGYIENQPQSVAVSAARNVAQIPGTKDSVTPSASPSDERVARAVVHSSNTRKHSGVMPPNPAARSSRRTPVTAPTIPSPAPNIPSPVTAVTAILGPIPAETLPAPITAPRPPVSLTTLPAIHAAGTASPAQFAPPAAAAIRPSVPSAISQGPARQDGDDISRTAKTPTLLRRRPQPAFSEDGTELASEDSPPTVSAPLGANRDGYAGATHAGTVRITSLGAMASNLMYSPVPAYPAAAYASHIQGEVRLSADVDRDGNVGSVRVISGPPLLREAALDAVQRWRYRPYISSGGPIPMAAVSIMDFQLP